MKYSKKLSKYIDQQLKEAFYNALDKIYSSNYHQGKINHDLYNELNTRIQSEAKQAIYSYLYESKSKGVYLSSEKELNNRIKKLKFFFNDDCLITSKEANRVAKRYDKVLKAYLEAHNDMFGAVMVAWNQKEIDKALKINCQKIRNAVHRTNKISS